jgi:filamentous hemagglutinin family protein
MRRHTIHFVLAALLGMPLFAPVAHANPQGGVVVAGSGTIESGVTDTLVSQGSDRLVIDWQSFNLDVGERVVFDQPGAASAVLNRIGDQQASVIQGRIDANGQVFLVNPNGVIFGDQSRVSVGALVASGLKVDLDAFLAGNLSLFATDGGAGPVVNSGHIAAPGGVALVGGRVANNGLIQADVVHLAAGSSAVVDFYGDRLIGFSVAGSGTEAANAGTIVADRVVMTAQGAADVLTGVVNNSGMIAATGVVREGGVVRLVGSTVTQSGQIDVHSDVAQGGTVHLLGEQVFVASGSLTDASGATGGGIILVGGDFRGSGPLIADTTHIAPDAQLRADALDSGDGGKVVVWANRDTVFKGQITARGGENGGNGGLVEVSAADRLTFAGRVDTSAAAGNAGTVLLDPSTLTIIDAAAGGTQDAAAADGVILSGDPDNAANTLSWGAIDALAATSNVVLEATGQITVADVTGAAGGTITAADLVSLDLTGSGALTLRSTGAGVVFADTNDTIRTEGGRVTIEGLGAAVSVGLIDTTGAAGTQTGGAVNISAAGDLFATAITTLGANVALNADIAGNVAGAILSPGIVNSGGSAIFYQGGADLNDTLQAPNQANNWTVTGTGGGTLNAGSFGNFGNLAGGSGNDGFVFGPLGVVPGTIFGGNGADSVNYQLVATPINVNLGTDLNAVEAVLAGGVGDRLTGADTPNSWHITGLGAGNVGGVSFNGFSGLTGGGSTDTFTLAGGSMTDGIDGGGGSDTLVGQNITNDWQLTGAGSGTLNGPGGLTFSAMETVTGGAQADSFTLVGGSVTGSINGGAGSDVLMADNLANSWTINGADRGTLTGGTGAGAFTGIETVIGGSNDDVFVFDADGAISGSINGGAHVLGDRVDLSAAVAPQAIEVGNNYTGIESFVGDGVNDSLFVGHGDQTWNQTGVGNGTVAGIGFSAMGALIGGNGNDILNISSGANNWDVTGIGSGAMGDGTGRVAFSGMDALTGGAGNDVFALAGGSITGAVLGAGGSDTLVSDNLATNWSVTGADSGSVTGVGSFAEIENLVGGSAADTFTIAPGGTISGEVLGGAGNDTLAIHYTGSSSPIFRFNGGTGSDSVSLTGSADSGVIDAGLDGTLLTISYQSGAESLTVLGRELERINDSVVANQLTILGTAVGELADLNVGTIGGNNPAELTIGALPVLAYSDKNSVRIDLGAGTDTLNLSGPVTVPVAMYLAAETITATPGSTLTTGSLTLSGPSGVGTDAQPLSLDVADLQILQATHHVFVENQSGLTLLASDLGADLTLRLGGELVSHESLTVGGNLTVRVSLGADIILDGAGSRFDGALDLASTDPITGSRNIALGTLSLVDSTDIALQHMSLSGDLLLSGQGISQEGALLVAGNTSLDGGAEGISFNLPGNRFTGPVSVTTSAGNVVLENDLALALAGVSVGTGSIILTGDGISQTAAVVQAPGAGTVSFNGAGGAVVMTHADNSLTGTLSVEGSSANIVAGAPIRIGTIRTNGDVTLTADGGMLLGQVTAGTGRINLVASGNVVSNEIAGVQLSGATLLVNAPGQSFGSFLQPVIIQIAGSVHFAVAEAFFSGTGSPITSTAGASLTNVNAMLANIALGRQVVPWRTAQINPLRLESPPRLFALSAGGLNLPPEGE